MAVAISEAGDVGEVGVVSLNWVEKRNSLGPDDAAELAAAIEDAGKRYRAVVLTGEGAFCSGGDLRTFARITAGASVEDIQQVVYGKIHSVVRALRDCPVPTVAAVDGAAVGLGMDLALACDVRFVGPAGWIQQGWSRAGLIAAGAGSYFLSRIDDQLPWTLMINQERLDAAACERLRIAVAAPEGARVAAVEAAKVLAALPDLAQAGYVALNRGPRWPSDEYLDSCASTQAQLLTSAEFQARVSEILGTPK